MSADTAKAATEADTAVVHRSYPHESARLHVTGAATYIDDMREPAGTLHVACGLSPKARGRLLSLGLDEVRRATGVVAVLGAVDVPGSNDIAPHARDEPMFAAFPLSVGVANVMDQIDRISRPPAYVTERRSGAGFVELTNYLLAARCLGG
mgnify:CR=1 FL=1